MQIDVRRGGYGPMSGALCALGIAAGLVTLLVPPFRPFALVEGRAVATWRMPDGAVERPDLSLSTRRS